MTHTLSRTALCLAISALLAAPGNTLAQSSTPRDSAQEETTDTQARTRPVPAPESATQEQQATNLDRVEVTAEYIPEPMLQSSGVMQVVTKQDLARTGDSNAAQALTRVAGLNLSQGKFIYVRGLGERYSSALLNGSPLPSPEPLKRVVPLDLFPANVLQKIEVQKTYSARFPGEFGGGLINLSTVSTPDVPFLTLSVSTGGNSETTFQSGLTYYGSDTDFLGYDDGTRKMQAPLRAAVESGKRISSANFSDAQLKEIGRSFVNAPLNLLQTTDSIDPDFGINASAGRSFKMSQDAELGLLAVVGFKNKWRTQIGTQQDGAVENGVMVVRSDYDYLSTSNDVTVNALVGAGMEWADHKINLTTLYVHDTSKETRSREGVSAKAGEYVRDDNTQWFERELVDTQLAGEHMFGEYRDWQVDWRVSHARASRDAPYEKGIRYRRIDGVGGFVYQHDASRQQNYTRFSNVTDRVSSAGVDVVWNLPTERDGTLSFGYAWLDNERYSWSREFRFLALDGALPYYVQFQRPDFLFSDYNISQGYLDLRETTGGDGAAAYDGSLETDAVYVELDTQLSDRLRGTAGVRYESAVQEVRPIDLFSDQQLATAAPLDNDYFLPTATLTWTFADNRQLRLAASNTIARPQFRELAPQQYLDLDRDRLLIGNPYLVDSELLNLDARYEWYFDQGQYFSAGVFYKHIERPIEAILNVSGSSVQQSFINAPRATLYGVELDFKKYFDGLGDWLGDNRLYLASNYTWSTSEVGVDDDDVVFPLAGNGQPRPAAELVRDGSQLQGQSEHLANLQFGVENPASGSRITLLLNYASERISARGLPGQPDYIVEPGTVIDLVASKAFMLGGTEMTLDFEARNLLNEQYQEYQELGGGRVDINRYDIGTSYTFSISASF